MTAEEEENYMGRPIEELFIFVCANPNSPEDESIPATVGPSPIPFLVVSDPLLAPRERLQDLRARAQKVADDHGLELKLIRLVKVMEEAETIKPRPKPQQQSSPTFRSGKVGIA